jgi:sarcosine oxidase
MSGQTYDTAVIGAGVFGAWTAYRLRESGQTVALLDGYGPAHLSTARRSESTSPARSRRQTPT